MTLLQKPIKLSWHAYLQGMFLFRFLLARLLCGSVFRSVGRGTRFYGWPTIGSVEANITLGRGVFLAKHVVFSASRGAWIDIGDHCSINAGSHLVAVDSIQIGEETRIAEYVSIRDQNHRFDDLDRPIREQGYNASPISIGKRCWIGRGAFIGAGVTIGDGTIIGANAVVVSDLPANVVAAGVPARILRRLDDLKPVDNLA